MDELKGWEHVAEPRKFRLDPVLRQMCNKNNQLVSFVFANERDAQKLTGQEVVAERAFAADEAEITCASQQQDRRLEPEIEIVCDDEGDENSDDDD